MIDSSDRLPALPLAMWIQRELARLDRDETIESPFGRLAHRLGVDSRLLGLWRDEINSEGVPRFTLPCGSVEDALDRAGVGLWEVFPGIQQEQSARETHRYCPACKESSAVDGDLLCLWCGGPTEAEQPKRRRRGGWKRPGRTSLYSEAQLRALHVFHTREGLSINELAKRTFAATGYKTHGSAASAISKQWKSLGLPARDRIAATVAASTRHGMAPKHGPRPGYGTYKRRVLRSEADQPLCQGVRQNHPRKGEPCGRPATKGSRFCPQHDPELAVRRRIHLERVHARQRAALAASAVPMAPFAAFVDQMRLETGSIHRAGERLGLHPSAVSTYARGLGSDKKPKETIQRATVERVFEHAGVTFEEIYEPEAIAA